MTSAVPVPLSPTTPNNDRTPLLSDPTAAAVNYRGQDPALTDLEENTLDVETAETPPAIIRQKTSTWNIVWRAVLALLIVGVIAILIKGFVDADDDPDVEVR